MDKINRSIIYKYLSIGIDYPEDLIIDSLKSGYFFKTLRDILKFDENLIKIIENLENENFKVEELPIIYTTNFDLKIPLYGSHYLFTNSKPEEKAKYLYELEKFYINEGVSLDKKEMPDFLGTELEFMHYLITEDKIEKQKLFLEKYLLSWIDKLIEKIKDEKIYFYKNLIILIEKFLKLDFSNLIK